MDDKPFATFFGLGMGSAAVIFGVGLVSGALLRRFIFWGTRSSSNAGGSGAGGLDTFQRAARLTALRAQGLGRNHKMIFVVRTDLGMGKGKIAAQCWLDLFNQRMPCPKRSQE